MDEIANGLNMAQYFTLVTAVGGLSTLVGFGRGVYKARKKTRNPREEIPPDDLRSNLVNSGSIREMSWAGAGGLLVSIAPGLPLEARIMAATVPPLLPELYHIGEWAGCRSVKRIVRGIYDNVNTAYNNLIGRNPSVQGSQ